MRIVALSVLYAAWLTGAVIFSPGRSALQSRTRAAQKVRSDVQEACNLAYTIAVGTRGVSIRRRTGDFRDETLRQPVFGCGLAISGSFSKAEETGDAAARLHREFAAHGWEEMAAYAADGKDGTSFAFKKAHVACLARGAWNGGADDEPEATEQDSYTVTLFCTTPVFPEQRQ